MKQTEILAHVTYLNGLFPAVYMSYTSQNFRLFHVSNLFARNFLFFLHMYPRSLSQVVCLSVCLSSTSVAVACVGVGPFQAAVALVEMLQR